MQVHVESSSASSKHSDRDKSFVAGVGSFLSSCVLRIKASVLELPNDRDLLFRPSLSLAVDDNREFSVTSNRSFPRSPYRKGHLQSVETEM